MTRQVSTLNVLASSQQPKASRQNNNIALNRLINLTSTMMRKQLQSMIRNYYNNDTPISQSQHPSHSLLSGQAIYHLDHLMIHLITSWSKHPHDHLVTPSQTEWSSSRSSQHRHPAKLLLLTISTYKSPISHSVIVSVDRTAWPSTNLCPWPRTRLSIH